MSKINNVIGLEVRRRLMDIEDIKRDSDESVKRSLEAKENADEAKHRSDITKKQLDEALKDGDQVYEVQTLRVDPVTGEVYDTAADRFEANQRMFSSQLTDIVINIKEFGASEDSEDNTEAIQDTINYVHLMGGGIVLIPIGVFNVSNTIDLKEKVSLIGRGYGSVIKQTKRKITTIHCKSYNTIKRLTIDGGDKEGSSPERPGTGVYVGVGVVHVRVEICEIINTTSDAVCVNTSYTKDNPIEKGNIIVRDCEFKDNGRQGISVVDAVTVTIDNNAIYRSNLTGIDIEAHDLENTFTKDIKVVNNTIIDPKQYGVWLKGASGEPSENSLCHISNNTIERSGGHGIRVEKMTETIVNDNTINGCGGQGVYLTEHVSDVNIVNNTIVECDGGVGLRDSERIEVALNHIKDCHRSGIRLTRTASSKLDDISILGNRVYGCNGYAVHLYNYNYYIGEKIMIQANKFFNNSNGSWQSGFINKEHCLVLGNQTDDGNLSMLQSSDGGLFKIDYIEGDFKVEGSPYLKIRSGNESSLNKIINPSVGEMYFLTTGYDKPVWWTGEKWVFADGSEL